jgi:hypothetical protein
MVKILRGECLFFILKIEINPLSVTKKEKNCPVFVTKIIIFALYL